MKQKISLNLNIFLFSAALLTAAAGFILIKESPEVLIPLALMFIIISIQAFMAIRGYRQSRNSIGGGIKQIKEDYIEKINQAVTDFARGNIASSIESVNPNMSNLQPDLLPIAESLVSVIGDFNAISAVPLNRLCYLGADSYMEGFHCGRNMARLIKEKGHILILVKEINNIGHYLRSRGFISALSSFAPFLQVTALEEENEIPDLTYNISREYLESDPELKGIYITEGTTPYSAARAVESLQSSVKVVTHDITEKTAQYLEKGFIQSTLSQSPYLQGFNSLATAYNYILTGEEPLVSRILINLEEITQENVRDHWNSGKGQLLSGESERSKIQPKENPEKKEIRIGFIIPETIEFWEPVFRGAQEAADLLKGSSCSVDILSLSELPGHASGADLFKEGISKILKNRPDAICIPVYEPELTEDLNQQISDGVTVVTYNSEPFNLRSILKTVIHATGKLFSFSEDMASNSRQSSKATSQISQQLKSIDSQTTEQLEKLQETLEKMVTLQNFVDESSTIVEQSMETGKNTFNIAEKGSRHVHESSLAAETARKGMAGLSSTTEELSQKVLKIKEIITIINDMASETNTIAINAGILAAKAGEDGKGFSVVATEIRKLAIQSASYGEEISQIVADLTKSTEDTLNWIEEGQNSVRISSERSSEAASILEEIIEATQNNKTNNERMQDFFNRIQEISLIVKQSMNDLTSMNQENSNAIGEITQAANRISQQVIQDSQSAQHLTDMAESQNRVLAQYFDQESQ